MCITIFECYCTGCTNWTLRTDRTLCSGCALRTFYGLHVPCILPRESCVAGDNVHIIRARLGGIGNKIRCIASHGRWIWQQIGARQFAGNNKRLSGVTFRTLRTNLTFVTLWTLRTNRTLRAGCTGLSGFALIAFIALIALITFGTGKRECAYVEPIRIGMCAIGSRPNIQNIWRRKADCVCIAIFSGVCGWIGQRCHCIHLSNYFDAKLIEYALFFEHILNILLIFEDLLFEASQLFTINRYHLLSPYLRQLLPSPCLVLVVF